MKLPISISQTNKMPFFSKTEDREVKQILSGGWHQCRGILGKVVGE
jgi:hypothetical protein